MYYRVFVWTPRVIWGVVRPLLWSPRSDPSGVKHMWGQSQAWVRHEDDARGSGECVHETWYVARLSRGCTVVWRCECLC